MGAGGETAVLPPAHLRYRIRRVEELTGGTSVSARYRIEFWLALRGRSWSREDWSPHRDQGRRVPGRADPAGVRELVDAGHEVLVQKGAGLGSAITDEGYTNNRARRSCPTPRAVFAEADMIVKVKEPQPVEVRDARTGPLLFTYLHLAADIELTHGPIRSGATASPTRRSRTSRPAAAADADERGRRQDRRRRPARFMLEKPLAAAASCSAACPASPRRT